MNIESSTLRILDASLNRAAEGLRVVEDYVRFVLDDAHLTSALKRLRHDLAEAGGALPLAQRHVSRDTAGDVGTAVTTHAETVRRDAWHVCVSSFERVKQSLRTLEEFGKLAGPELGARFEALRYRLYVLEAAIGRTVDAAERLAAVRLYVLIDGRESEAEFTSLVESLVAAGVHAIQLRAKRLSDRDLISRARLLQSMLNQLPAPSLALPIEGREPEENLLRRPLAIINDRPDVAAIVDADGVHLGQDDMQVQDARAIVGPRRLIGVSTHSIDQARAAVLDGANYIGVGPTFLSTTKNFDRFPGLEYLRQVAAEIRLPAFAIGGITLDNAEAVLATGVARLAVSGAVAAAASPASAVAKLLALFDRNSPPAAS